MFPCLAIHLHSSVQQPHRLIAVTHCVHAEGIGEGAAALSLARIASATFRARKLRNVDGLPVGALGNGSVSVEKHWISLSALCDGETVGVGHSLADEVLARVERIKVGFPGSQLRRLRLLLYVAVDATVSLAADIHCPVHRSVGQRLLHGLEAAPRGPVSRGSGNCVVERIHVSPLPYVAAAGSVLLLRLLREWSAEGVGSEQEAQSQRAGSENTSVEDLLHFVSFRSLPTGDFYPRICCLGDASFVGALAFIATSCIGLRKRA